MKLCEICCNEIPDDRVECVPETKLCITHARMIEKYGGEFILTATQDNLGKAGSLKKNYGDISDIKKQRNMDALERLKKALDI